LRAERHLGIRMRVQHLLRDAKHVREKHVGIERRGRDPRRAKERHGGVPLLAPSPHLRGEVSSRGAAGADRRGFGRCAQGRRPIPPARPARAFATFVCGSRGDRKSTRLNSSHLVISYAVFCLKKKKKK